MPWSFLVRDRLRAFSRRPSTLAAVRRMGGGPRTFPGGLNKWQFKRMHEKMAREKERKLLEQEKQLYEARLRSQIRAGLAGHPPPPFEADHSAAPTHGPMTAKEHVKALADRFMKQGAEDLWNEDDGPLRDAPVPGRHAPSSDPVPPLDLRKLISERRNLAESGAWKSTPPLEPFGQRRHYSIEARSKARPKAELKSRWYPDSDSDLDSESWVEDELLKPFGRRESGSYDLKHGLGSNFPRLSAPNGESDEEESELEGGRKKKMMMSGAALMNYDRKKMRRAPRPAEKEEGLHEEVQRIRDELEKRKQDAAGTGTNGLEEESLFTQRR